MSFLRAASYFPAASTPKQYPFGIVVRLMQYSPGANWADGTAFKEEFPYFSTLIPKESLFESRSLIFSRN